MNPGTGERPKCPDGNRGHVSPERWEERGGGGTLQNTLENWKAGGTERRKRWIVESFPLTTVSKLSQVMSRFKMDPWKSRTKGRRISVIHP